MKAKCVMPVEIYDEGLRGYYQAGQIVEGEAAAKLIERYPALFVAVDMAPKARKGAAE